MKSNYRNWFVTVFVRVWGPWKSWWTRVKPPLGCTVSGTSESWIAWIAVTWRQIHISRSAMRSSDRMDWATPRRAWEYPRSQVKLVPWLQSEWINSANKQLVDGFAQPSQGMSVRVNGSLIFVCNGKWVDVLWTQIENLRSKVAYQLVIINDLKEIFSSIIPKTEFSWIVHSLMRISGFFRYLSHSDILTLGDLIVICPSWEGTDPRCGKALCWPQEWFLIGHGTGTVDSAEKAWNLGLYIQVLVLFESFW